MNRTKKLLMSSLVAVALGLAATAQAQDSPPPSPPPSSGGGGAIIGGGAGAGIGVGAAVLLADGGAPALPAAQFVYDMALLHFEGLFGFTSAENGAGDRVSNLVFGAGGWYHLHRGSSSDFSLGAAIAIATNTGPGPSTTVTAFEPGATVRAFLTPNVALFARAGLLFLFGDTGNGTHIDLGGQAAGAFGFTYFFR